MGDKVWEEQRRPQGQRRWWQQGSLLELGWGEDPGMGAAQVILGFMLTNDVEVRTAEHGRDSKSGSSGRKDAGMEKRVWKARQGNGQTRQELRGGKYH